MDLQGATAIHHPGLALVHWSGWLAGPDRQSLRCHLEEAIPWDQPEVMVYGRRHRVPRLVAWYGDRGCAYRYSGHCHEPLAWTPPLAALRLLLQSRLGLDFNSLLLNRYRSGADRMGWHADDEPELEARHPIASLSLGATRALRFRPRPRRGGFQAPLVIGGDQPQQPALPFGLDLADGDLLLMESPTQQHWQHGLPSRLRLQQERFNLTFRRIRPH